MLTISRAISAGQASNYYKQELTNSQDNYYREAGEGKSRWSGRLASQSCWFRLTISPSKQRSFSTQNDPRTCPDFGVPATSKKFQKPRPNSQGKSGKI
jgi:hypothetical protein